MVVGLEADVSALPPVPIVRQRQPPAFDRSFRNADNCSSVSGDCALDSTVLVSECHSCVNRDYVDEVAGCGCCSEIIRC